MSFHMRCDVGETIGVCKMGKYVSEYSCGHHICSLCEPADLDGSNSVKLCALCLLKCGTKIVGIE